MGPTTENDEILSAIIKNGMNIARFNFSHGTHEYHKSQMERVRKLSDELQIPVALMMDTKGPEIRTGNTDGGNTVQINKGDDVLIKTDDSFTKSATSTTPANISLNWNDFIPRISQALKEEPSRQIKVLIADGLLELDVISADENAVKAKAANSAKIGSKKNVNLIGIWKLN